jgi:hypothetical protein
MGKADREKFDAAKRLMGALVRMPPKPHEEMKLGRKIEPKNKLKRSRNVSENPAKKKRRPEA